MHHTDKHTHHAILYLLFKRDAKITTFNGFDLHIKEIHHANTLDIQCFLIDLSSKTNRGCKVDRFWSMIWDFISNISRKMGPITDNMPITDHMHWEDCRTLALLGVSSRQVIHWDLLGKSVHLKRGVELNNAALLNGRSSARYIDWIELTYMIDA